MRVWQGDAPLVVSAFPRHRNEKVRFFTASWRVAAFLPDKFAPGLNTAGYHEDLSRNRTVMYQDNGHIAGYTANQFSFNTIDTYQGQSGSPLWISYNDQSIIVGVLSHEDASYNYGMRITADKLTWNQQAVKR
jgi:V8-like Glu-specific endopeptidase